MMRPEDYEGRITVIMPCRNEGEWPGRTVNDLRQRRAKGTRLRFVVIDDGSEDACCKCFRGDKDVMLMHNKVPRGQGVCRSVGVHMMKDETDCFVSIDSHMLFPDPYHLEGMAIMARETSGFVGCLTHNMADGTDVPGVGRTWDCSYNRNGRLEIRTENATHPNADGGVDVLRGACYAFMPETFRYLGNFGESYGLHGWFERDLAVRCKFLGIPQDVHTGLRSQHLYRDRRPYLANGMGLEYGRVESFRSMFGQDTFDRVFRPSAEARATTFRDPLLWYLLRDHRFLGLAQRFADRKSAYDADVLRWMGIDPEGYKP